jgi:hypothetical protein
VNEFILNRYLDKFMTTEATAHCVNFMAILVNFTLIRSLRRPISTNKSKLSRAVIFSLALFAFGNAQKKRSDQYMIIPVKGMHLKQNTQI